MSYPVKRRLRNEAVKGAGHHMKGIVGRKGGSLSHRERNIVPRYVLDPEWGKRKFARLNARHAERKRHARSPRSLREYGR